jgi:branched-chain amino acid transport system ATP-binding protein
MMSLTTTPTPEATTSASAPPAPGDAVLELRSVRAVYGKVEVLHGVNLAVPAGGVLAVLGPNGAGKSTMLRVASGLHAPSAGDIFVAGRRVTGVRPELLARRGLCTIPEGRGIFPNLTVRENLRMATHAGTRLAAVEEVAYTRFRILGERRHQPAGTLSGGEQQMLSMARALSVNPAVLLLDELSMGLAPLIVEQLYTIVRAIAAEGVSILVVEQFAQTVLSVADRAAVMVHGKVVMEGGPEQIRASLSDAYLGG